MNLNSVSNFIDDLTLVLITLGKGRSNYTLSSMESRIVRFDTLGMMKGLTHVGHVKLCE